MVISYNLFYPLFAHYLHHLLLLVQKSDKLAKINATKKKDDDNDDIKLYKKRSAEALKPIEDTIQSTYASTRHRIDMTITR